MRLFRQRLPLGTGFLARSDIALLHQRLDDAITCAGGMQQGVPTDSPEYAEGERYIEDALRDLATALTGRELALGEKIPRSDTVVDLHGTKVIHVFLNERLVPDRQILWVEKGLPTFTPDVIVAGPYPNRRAQLDIVWREGSTYQHTRYTAEITANTTLRDLVWERVESVY